MHAVVCLLRAAPHVLAPAATDIIISSPKLNYKRPPAGIYKRSLAGMDTGEPARLQLHIRAAFAGTLLLVAAQRAAL
jgi:hypothetical protein